MTDAAALQQLWEDLNAPSAVAFRKALVRKGIQVRAKDVAEFVRSKSERQVIAPAPKYTGHIVSSDIDERWAADVISFTSRAASEAANTKEFKRLRPVSQAPYTHVLLVQDIFSRFIWATPMRSVSDTTAAVRSIMRQTRRKPVRFDTGGGGEFTSTVFEALMAEKDITHVVKDRDDRNAIATVDSAIGQLKRAIKRRREQHGGTWLDQLEAAV
jgi:hypothetical protein